MAPVFNESIHNFKPLNPEPRTLNPNLGMKEWKRKWKLLKWVIKGLLEGSVPSLLANQKPVHQTGELQVQLPTQRTAISGQVQVYPRAK